MSTYDQPRGSRETYEKLSDPAMYWTQTNGEPVREPVRTAGDDADSTQVSAQVGPVHEQDERGRPDRLAFDDTDTYREEDPEEQRRERFGGVNWGAGFFGWLVAVGMALLLTGVASGLAVTLNRTVDAVSTTVESQPRTTVLVAGVALVAVLMLAYYSGGYVAGRMSRFDGGKQGAAVWVTGLLLTMLAAGFALFFGAGLDALSRFDLPSLPVPADSLGPVALVAAVGALLGSLLAAVGGGKVGCRYHSKVDAYR